ncbi:MAG: DNA polymerase III subunit beta [bacterium]
MKISCLKENLYAGLQTVSRTVGARTTLPVLKNILLQTEGGRLKMSATDLELGIICWVGAKVEKEGTLTVPAKLLMEYVSTLPNKKIDLEFKNNTLHLHCESYKATFTTIDADEFPEIPTFEGETKVAIKADVLKKAIQKVVFATSKDESRPVLSGVYIESEDNLLTLVSADGYRLVEKKVPLQQAFEGKKFSIIVPHRALVEVARGTFEEDAEITLQISNNQVLFSTKDSLIFSRLIEGKFPDYKKIIPQDTTNHSEIIIPRGEFLQAIKVNHLFAQDGSDAVHLEIDKTAQQLTISASTNQIGQSASTVGCKVKGKSESISFNANYLIDVLNVVSSEDVKMLISESANPGMIYDTQDDQYIYVVMPVKQL